MRGMATTQPIAPTSVKMKRFSVTVLSGEQRGRRFVPDPEGSLRVGRAQRLTSTKDDDLAAPGASAWLMLDDPMVSHLHLTLESQPGHVRLRDHSSNGTWIGATRVFGGSAELIETTDLRVGETDLRVTVDIQSSTQAQSGRVSFGDLICASPSMQRLFARIARLAACDLPVLITGETGTGKSALAEAIHKHSSRAAKDFCELDFGAIKPSLLESDLFGHVRGAFTGAESDRKGMFEEAVGGTVLLDEIGDLTLEAQPRLLRVLERKTVRRLGSNEDRPVNVRVIAATQCNLPAMVNESRFRRDLYERLAVCVIEMPPLRERRDDIIAIAEHLLDRIRKQGAVEVPDNYTFSAADRAEMMGYHWPGNIRELGHYLERKFVLDETPLRQSRVTPPPGLLDYTDLLPLGHKDAVEELQLRFEREYLRHHLAAAEGRMGRAAARTGLHRVTFSQKVERAGLKRLVLPSEDGKE